jgi:tetratricopeptide (TPR) repeat protein
LHKQNKLLSTLLAVFLWHCGSVVSTAAATVDTNSPAPLLSSNRLTVAILGFENKTGNPSNAFWDVAIGRLVGGQLEEVKSLRLLPGLEYALRQINKKKGDHLETADAARAGRFIEARRVIWGSYQLKHDQRSVTVHVLNPASGKESDFTATDADWFALRDQLVKKILKELSLQPTTAERKKMSDDFTSSSKVLEFLAKAITSSQAHHPLAEAEKYARQAADADTNSPYAQDILAQVMGNQGNLKEAEKAARRAIQLEPDLASAWLDLGILLEIGGNFEEAETFLQKAAHLDPDSDDAWERLGELRAQQSSYSQAIDYFDRAVQLNPFSATIHARLAAIYAYQGQRELALSQLKVAEPLADPENGSDEQSLGQTYDTLSDTSSAITHYENFISEAKREGLNPSAMAEFGPRLKYLKQSLTPAYVVASQPKEYSSAELAQFLQQKLSPAELGLITNPIACTPQMDRWAHELTPGATNDFARAKALFDGLAKHVDTGIRGWRTAEETFALWDTPGISLVCEDYALLYVALGRAVGIKAYEVYVEEDYDGKQVTHACAGVFLDGKALLVDPAYNWFGVPHKKFTVLDDVQATAAYLCSPPVRLELAQIAARLDPGSDIIQLNVASALIGAQRWPEARRVLSKAFPPEKHGWFADMARGEIELNDEHLKLAADLFEKAISENENCGQAYFGLGYVFLKQGSLKKARLNLRKSLALLINNEMSEQARIAIAQINEEIGNSDPDEASDVVNANDFINRGNARVTKKDYKNAIDDFSKALQLDPRNVTALVRRGAIYAETGDFDRAWRDCNAAFQVDSNHASAFLLRGGLYEQKNNLDSALSDLNRSVELDPTDVEVYVHRAIVYSKQGANEKALADSRSALRLAPDNPQACYNLARMLLDESPDSKVKIGNEPLDLAQKACELTQWQASPCIQLLAMAYAAKGDYAQAVSWQEKALAINDVSLDLRANQKEWLDYWKQQAAAEKSLQINAPPKSPQEMKLSANVLGSTDLTNASAPSQTVQKGDTATDGSNLQLAAGSGDTKSQVQLAENLYEGKNGFPKDEIAAYKWAAIAAAAGDAQAVSLVKEFDIFMSQESITAGKKAASQYLEQAARKKAAR